MSQIKGVDSTFRKTEANLAAGAKLVINEKLMTHGTQTAHSDVTVNLNGEDSVVQIVSRSVGKDTMWMHKSSMRLPLGKSTAISW